MSSSVPEQEQGDIETGDKREKEAKASRAVAIRFMFTPIFVLLSQVCPTSPVSDQTKTKMSKKGGVGRVCT